MKRLIGVATISLALAVAMPSAKAAWWSSPDCRNQQFSTKELTTRSKPGVVMIQTDKSTGSGFVVRHVKGKTLILTNSHVITGATQVLVNWPDGNQDSATIVLDGGAVTTLTDLALLSVSGKEGVVLPLKKDQATVGGDVIAIGSPRGLGFTLTKGVISSLRDEGKIVQTDTAINPGSSGGPLINEAGCVVGVNTLAMTEDVGLNFAISSQTAQRFIDKYDPNTRQTNQSRTQNVVIKPQKLNPSPPPWKPKDIYKGDPEAAKEYLNRLWDLFGVKGKEQESIKLANIALRFDNNSAQAYHYRGSAKTALKDYAGALSDYTKAINIRPDNYIYYYNRAVPKRLSGDYKGSISDNTKAIKLKPDYVRAFNNRGVSKAKLEDYTGAISDYTKAIKLKPNYPLYYYNRGTSKAKLEDYIGAISDHTKAIKLRPDYDDAYVNRSFAKGQLNDIKGACDDYLQLSNIDILSDQNRNWVRYNCD